MNNDLISRDAFRKYYCKINCGERQCVDHADRCTFIDELMQFKTEPERSEGEWYYNYQNGWHCSICHKSVKDMPTVMGKADFAFCPNCGAKMQKSSGEEK